MNSDREGTPSVLVVDDTPTNVGLLLEMLGGEGYRVLVARDGRAPSSRPGTPRRTSCCSTS